MVLVKAVWIEPLPLLVYLAPSFKLPTRWNLWNCEKLGTEVVRAIYPKMKVVGSNPVALERVHGLFHGSKRVSLNGLSYEDKQVVLKYLPEDYTIC